jgi:hypothetical protein
VGPSVMWLIDAMVALQGKACLAEQVVEEVGFEDSGVGGLAATLDVACARRRGA